MINVYELFGDFAVSDADGETLHEKIENDLKTEKIVVIDFTNVETVLIQFLNSAIATLYKEHTSDELREKLEIKGLKSYRFFAVCYYSCKNILLIRRVCPECGTKLIY